MVDAFGGAGPRLWRGRRRGRELSALQVMAELRGAGGKLLPARAAAVELINVVRPTVAIPWYIAFVALALHEHPEARHRLAHEPVGEVLGNTPICSCRRFAASIRLRRPVLTVRSTVPGTP